MRVVIAPDSFKGSLDAVRAADAIASGWRRARPHDEVITIPLADGGEGTTDVLRLLHPDAVEHHLTVRGPDDRPVESGWLTLADGTAVVELARASGLPLMRRLDPLSAHTYGLGEVLRAVVAHPSTHRIVVALGGSASTDGGAGALAALGARWLDSDGCELTGGGDLSRCVRVDPSELVGAPVGGVRLLVDVEAPLLGPLGAAQQFGPQKGAGPADIAHLEAAMAAIDRVCRVAPSADRRTPAVSALTPGVGAAGGTAYGLAALWGGTLVAGAPELARLAGLDEVLEGAGLVITGEGRLDEQSLRGKVVGNVVRQGRAHGIPVQACVGTADRATADQLERCEQLVALAGGLDAALDDPARWLELAGEGLARARTHRDATDAASTSGAA
ncbi:glycerate kinase [Janibacter sp. HTCC2649]|uniref:glycerate kinase n=1 Tax=Janibacter sp. HTCC2649 TaxID=313589 RepID=UPI0000670CD6|nr:glycerate kinase [Janibacter sp. HTCC2649]EAQ00692.1 glycerate kinase [Janibacter sp. HTCC2649]